MGSIKFDCPHCATHLDIPEDAAGSSMRCPNCGVEIQVPAVPAAAGSAATETKCGICLSPILSTEARQVCPACGAEYHSDCWQENGGCAVYGCSQVPTIEKRQAIDIPMSYWGQEKKQCPNCKGEIQAAAVRCRHCGATFESARPQATDEFQQRGELKMRQPALRRSVIWLFAFSVVPCCAPIGAIWGLMWYPAHKEEVRALPSLYGALCKIGLVVAIGQTVLVVLLSVLFALIRN
jgi:predicted RNA-binding Zn-ribbon protein involved in translation (DUF1610 family)